MSFSRNAQTKFVTTVTHPIPKRHVKNPSSTSQLLGMPSRRRRTRWQNERQLFQLPTPAALRRRVSSTPQSAQRLTAKRHARHGLPHSWRSRFQKGRKVVKVYGLRVFVRLLRVFGLLVEIYRLVPFSCHRGNGVSDVTATACVWGTVTPARTWSHYYEAQSSPSNPTESAIERQGVHGCTYVPAVLLSVGSRRCRFDIGLFESRTLRPAPGLLLATAIARSVIWRHPFRKGSVLTPSLSPSPL